MGCAVPVRQQIAKINARPIADWLAQSAVDRLNHRPRKVLGFRTPFEVFFGKTVRYTKSPLGVVLRN